MDHFEFVLWVAAIIGIEMVLLWWVHAASFRGLRSVQLQLMDAWRQSMVEWRAKSDRDHAENMAFHRDHSVALRAILERVDRERG